MYGKVLLQIDHLSLYFIELYFHNFQTLPYNYILLNFAFNQSINQNSFILFFIS